MKSLNLTSIGRAFGTDARSLKSPGILLPLKAKDPPMLVTKWDESFFVVLLGGQNAFMHMPITRDVGVSGLFVPEPEILVDFSSAVDGVNLREEQGLLFLKGNNPSVTSVRGGNGWPDVTAVPLWSEIEASEENVHVCFKKWGVGLRYGDRLDVLWSFDQESWRNTPP